MYHYTVGLLATGPALNKPTLIKVCAHGEQGDAVTLTVESARNLAPIKSAGAIVLTWAEFEGRPRDNIEEARWAFALFDLSID